MKKFKDILNGDGIDTIESFYSLLWSTNESAENLVFDFRLPNTIVFKDHCPFSWFFSDKHGIIKKKNTENSFID